MSSGACVVQVRRVLLSFCSCFFTNWFVFVHNDVLSVPTAQSGSLSPFSGDVYSFCSPLPSVPPSGGNKIIENRCFLKKKKKTQHLTYSIDPYQKQALYVVTPGREA